MSQLLFFWFTLAACIIIGGAIGGVEGVVIGMLLYISVISTLVFVCGSLIYLEMTKKKEG